MRLTLAILVACLLNSVALCQGPSGGGPGQGECINVGILTTYCAELKTEDCLGAVSLDYQRPCSIVKCHHYVNLNVYACIAGRETRVKDEEHPGATISPAASGGTNHFQSTDCVYCIEERGCGETCLPFVNTCNTNEQNAWTDFENVALILFESTGEPCSPIILL